MADNRLIMKNAAFMAVRMLFSLLVNLYTSRVILQQLGVEDFGIYWLIAGLTLIMAFFKYSLTAAFQRYMNVELAITKGTGMQQVFSASWACVFIMIVILLLLAESAGLWFLNSELNVPAGRMGDAHVVYQLSLLIVIIELLRVPYNSLIIACEKMSFYAYNSIFEVTLKLAVALLLTLFAGNKLFIYMYLLVGVAVLINLSYVFYTRKIQPSLRFRLKADKSQISEISKFAGWNILSSIADISYLQGSAMILNVLFGVTLNATWGITNQIKTAVYSITNSLQSAANPQIIKSFTLGEQATFVNLFVRISKISFYFTALIGIPLLLNAEYILSVWLTVIPPQAAIFMKLIVIFCLVDGLVGPLWVTMQASGKIARYQIVVSLVWLSCLPVTYVCYKLGAPAYTIIWVMTAIDTILIAIRILFTRKICRINFSLYFRKIVLNIICVSIVALALPVFLDCLTYSSDLAKLLATTSSWLVCMTLASYYIGFTKEEKDFVKSILNKLVGKFIS